MVLTLKTMEHTALQAQVADFMSACAYKPLEIVVDGAKANVFTIHVPQAFSKPVIEFSQALDSGLTVVTEVDDAGSVQELIISNLSSSYLIIYEGTILKGGKQNRVINATQLIPPFSKCTIPASCIEQGRWRRTSSSFQKSPHHSPSFLRKSIRGGIFEAKCMSGSQGSVWDEVRKYSKEAGIFNASGDFEDIYNRSRKASSLFPSGLTLPATEGLLLQVAGETTLDLISNAEAFGSILPQISPGYSFSLGKEAPALTGDPGKALAQIILSHNCFVQPAAAAGTDVRIETPLGHISALIVEGEVVSVTMMAA